VYNKDDETTIEIATKILKATSSEKIEEFINECVITKNFDHPNVLGLIGISIRENLPLMLLPYMHNGDVKSFLKSKRGGILEVTEYPEVVNRYILG